MSSIKVNDLWIEDSETGDNVILCIHGLGGTSNFWFPIMSAFDKSRVIRPDLAGAGRSTDAPENLSIANHVESLINLLDSLKVDKAHIVAHSMGTIIAQHLATSYPDRVLSLALFGPLEKPSESSREPTRQRANLARKGVDSLQEIADSIVNAATSTETKTERPVALTLIRESIMRQPNEGYARNCEALSDAQAAPIEQITVPVLLITGDEDGVGTPSGTKTLADKLSDQRFYVLQGCGHWTTYEKPFECIQILSDFYKL